MITVEIAAAVLIALSVVLPARGVVPRNRWLGIRTASTLRDTEAWQRSHRAVRRRPESDRPEPDGLEPDLRVTPPPAARSPSR